MARSLWYALPGEVVRFVLSRAACRLLIIGVWAICLSRHLIGRERAGMIASRWIRFFEHVVFGWVNYA